jgi:hypothetical protein
LVTFFVPSAVLFLSARGLWPLAPWPLLTFFLALLTHENGLLALPALVGVDWLRRPGDGPAARLRRLWPYGVAAALFVVLWLAIPKNSAQGLNGPGDIARNAVPFLQSLVFPLLPLLRLDAGDVAALAALAAATVAVLGLLAWRAGVGRLWLFGLGWVALAALPSLLFLGPAYVYGSPRLSYLPAIGWAAVGLLALIGAGEKKETRRFQVPGSRKARSSGPPGPWPLEPETCGFFFFLPLSTGALATRAAAFVACQLDFYAETSRLARAMGEIGRAAPAAQEVVFVNAPFFFSSSAARPDGCPNPYPWTPTGGILIPPDAQPRDFVRFNGGPDRAVAGVSFPATPPAGGRSGRRSTGRRCGGRGRAAVTSSTWAAGVSPTCRPLWQPGGRVRGGVGDVWRCAGLLTAAGETTGDALAVQLDWRVPGRAAVSATIFVHVTTRPGRSWPRATAAGGRLRAGGTVAPGDGYATNGAST